MKSLISLMKTYIIWVRLTLLFGKNNKIDFLFNGNHKTNNHNFDLYLKRLGYNFKNQDNELGGYVVLNSKKNSLIMDVGSSPNIKLSSNYQAGALSLRSYQMVKN